MKDIIREYCPWLMPNGVRAVSNRRASARAARDAAVMAEPDLGGSGFEMPFDGMRMIFGGFAHLLGDTLAAPGRSNGTVMPVPCDKRAE